MTTKRSPAAFWTIAALAFFGSVSAFAYAGVLVLFPNGLPSDGRIDTTELRATTKLRSPITFERTSGPGV